MHYGEMPRTTLGSSDFRSQVAMVTSTTKGKKRAKKQDMRRTYFRSGLLPVMSVRRHFQSKLYYYSSKKKKNALKKPGMRRTYFRSGPHPDREPLPVT